MNITLGMNRKIGHAMPAQQIKHVVKKPNARLNIVLPGAIQAYGQTDVSFLGFTAYRSLSHGLEPLF
jgi:hypothetical protein